MPTLRQIEYFVAVVDNGSFTRAAEELLVSQPGLSHQLKALEAEVGGPLVERLTRRIQLTPLGRATLPYARTTLEAAAGFARVAERTVAATSGTIRIATITSISLGVLPAVVRSWLRDRPERRVELSEHHHVDAMNAAMDAGLSDVAIGPCPAEWTGRSWEVGVEEFVVVAPADHRLGRRPGTTTVGIAELADERWVQYAEHHGLADAVTSICATAGFAPRVAARTEQTAAVAEYAAAGVGVAIVLTNMLGPDYPGLALRPDPPLPRTIHAFTRAEPDPLTRSFLDELQATAVLVPPHLAERFGTDRTGPSSTHLGAS